MGKHDYTLNNISAISGSLISCANIVENSILSVEAMPYSWDTGLLHTVVQWFEVLEILGERDKLVRLMQKADQRLAITARNIGRKDLSASASIDSGLTSLNTLNSTASNLLTELSDYSKVQECMPCEWKDCKIAAIYGLEDYVSYDSETGVYSIHNKSSLKELMSKEMLTETENGMIIRIISITVDDSGNINTNIMNDLLNCSYTSKKCSDMFPAYHVIATPGPNGSPIMTESITQIYYTEYTTANPL